MYKTVTSLYTCETLKSYCDAAISLQTMCGNKPSEHLTELFEKHKDGVIIEKKLRELYADNNGIINDLIAVRIAELLKVETLKIRTSSLKIIHKSVYMDIYSSAGKYRDFNIEGYATYNKIESIIKNQLESEIYWQYSKMSKSDIVKRACILSSGLYFAYPFPKGNLQTIALFMCLYYRGIGFNVDISAFSDSTVNYKNMLDKSVKLNDFSELERFYDRLLFREEET